MSFSCTRFQRWIEDEASGALGEPERPLLLAHLDSCPSCRATRRSSAELASLLIRVRPPVPPVDVRARVMARIRAEAEGARLRVRVSARAFWAAMVASFAAVCALGALATRAASAVPPEVLPAAGPLARLGLGFWLALRSCGGGMYTLLTLMLEATGHALGSFAFLIPLLETGVIAVVALTFLSASLPLARALWPARALDRAHGR